MDQETTKTTKYSSQSASDLLDQVEADISKISQGLSAHPIEILDRLDETQRRLINAEKEHHPLKAEQAQFDYVVSLLKKNAGRFIRALGGSEVLAELREEKQRPHPRAVWWYLDQWLAEEQKKTLRITGGYIIISVLSLVILALLYKLFLAPDPQTQALIDHQNMATQNLTAGKPDAALAEVNLALQLSPQNLDLLLMKGVAQTALGQKDQADATFAQARKVAPNEEEYYLARSLTFLQAGNITASQDDALAVIKIDPNSAEGYYSLGKAQEALGDTRGALSSLQTASDLAEKQNKPELTATIRMNMVMLLQSPQQPLPTQTPEPTPNE